MKLPHDSLGGTLAAGMTESIRCQNTPPDRVDCKER